MQTLYYSDNDPLIVKCSQWLKWRRTDYTDGQSKVLQYFALRRIHNISKGAVLSTSLCTMIEFITQRNIHNHCLVMGCEMYKRESGPFGEYKKGKHDMLTTSEQNPDITKFYKYKQVFLLRSCLNYKTSQELRMTSRSLSVY